VMAVGSFDGIHKGHRELIKQARELADHMKLELAVMTFHPHPKEVILKGKVTMDYLTPNSVKAEVFAALGVDCLYMVSFTEYFSSLSTERFQCEYLVGLQAKAVVVGFDFTYGYQGQGNTASLISEAAGKFDVIIIPKYEMAGQKVSSTLIRSLLRLGEVTKAAQYLGQTYHTIGYITEFEHSPVGIRWLQVSASASFTLPAPGSYAIDIVVNNQTFSAVGHICTEGGKQHDIRVSFTAPVSIDAGRSMAAIHWIEREVDASSIRKA
jgi:riboflavin kinase/FMN adenylyltransferase